MPTACKYCETQLECNDSANRKWCEVCAEVFCKRCALDSNLMIRIIVRDVLNSAELTADRCRCKDCFAMPFIVNVN